MPLTNTSKPTTSLTNIANVKDFETWDSNTTTFDTEIRTWDEMGSLMNNISAGLIGFLWSAKRTPWTETSPWLSEGGISNIARP